MCLLPSLNTNTLAHLATRGFCGLSPRFGIDAEGGDGIHWAHIDLDGDRYELSMECTSGESKASEFTTIYNSRADL